ncbi:MAG: hypothetical protein P0116_14625 [Candidatus Nitrosocosmicus sp.]|nr:hypothetical protein [Candidatus Nitrosocosmicus sp.]
MDKSIFTQRIIGGAFLGVASLILPSFFCPDFLVTELTGESQPILKTQTLSVLLPLIGNNETLQYVACRRLGNKQHIGIHQGDSDDRVKL